MNTDDIIDKFVAKLQSCGIEIKAIGSAPWVDQFASKLPKRLPLSFESLIKRYSFPVLELGNIVLYSNFGDSSYDDLSTAIFRDKAIYETTIKSGFIPFARPGNSSYDPVCFDVRTTPKMREYAIVRLDHEQILIHNQIKIINRISESFSEFAKNYIERPTKRFTGSA